MSMATPRDSKSTGWIYIKNYICIYVILVFTVLWYMAACMLHLCLFSFWMKICYHFWGKRAVSHSGISCRTSEEGCLWNCCFPQQQNGAELLLWKAETPGTQLLLSPELSRRKGWVTLLLTEAALSFPGCSKSLSSSWGPNSAVPQLLSITAAWSASVLGRECSQSSELVQRWENLLFSSGRNSYCERQS